MGDKTRRACAESPGIAEAGDLLILPPNRPNSLDSTKQKKRQKVPLQAVKVQISLKNIRGNRKPDQNCVRVLKGRGL
eukprot:1160351-Pelagomonas_calceolata.AAC.2